MKSASSLLLLFSLAAMGALSTVGCSTATTDDGETAASAVAADALANYKAEVDARVASSCGQAPNLTNLKSEHGRLKVSDSARASSAAVEPLANTLRDQVIPQERKVDNLIGRLQSEAQDNTLFYYPTTDRYHETMGTRPDDGLTVSYLVVIRAPEEYARIVAGEGDLQASLNRASTCTRGFWGFADVFESWGFAEGSRNKGPRAIMTSLQTLASDLAANRTRYTNTVNALKLLKRSGGKVNASNFFRLACGQDAQCEAEQLERDGGLGNHLGRIVESIIGEATDENIALLSAAIDTTSGLLSTVQRANPEVDATSTRLDEALSAFAKTHARVLSTHGCSYLATVKQIADRYAADFAQFRRDPSYSDRYRYPTLEEIDAQLATCGQ